MFCRLRTPEHKIKVLRPVKLRIQHTNLLEQRALHDSQMTDVVVDVQQIIIEVRLEIRFGVEPLVIDLVLVGINHLRLRMLVNDLHIFKERVTRHQIIVIAESDKITLRGSDSLVRVFRDLQLLSSRDSPDPRLLLLQLVKKSGER